MIFTLSSLIKKSCTRDINGIINGKANIEETIPSIDIFLFYTFFCKMIYSR